MSARERAPAPTGGAVRQLTELPLEEVRAHGGEGRLGFHRVFDADAFSGPWNFIDYAVLPPGVSIGRHRHGANEEVYLILEGEGHMHLDGEEFPVRAGHVIKNRSGGVHGLVNSSDAPLRIFVVEVALSMEAKGDETGAEDLGPSGGAVGKGVQG